VPCIGQAVIAAWRINDGTNLHVDSTAAAARGIMATRATAAIIIP
jgi:hypothetical protein